ncbi:MAG: tetratricopeptide repeat protein [Deltaproteobacteria bacterium]|nr:tetratricopeptide repeat protein [Deltaproteobacteria bacterium]MBW2016788.1 tetratricopeptide repeat protein [Deltaproteobacteria bacterium]MBW2128460.1 tetratricopeptide repeat protein [Deltaproteobacteria bacterium]MBW2303486.1 tetratricopeptide repeat protein [Deltaproteobacteria bacterium]
MSIPEDFYDEILRQGPSTETRFILLSRLKEEGRIEKVIRECRRALDISPRDIGIRSLLAECLLESGQPEEAEEELNQIYSQFRGLTRNFKDMAGVLKERGKPEAAEKAIHLYLAFHRDDPEAEKIIDELMPPGKPEPDVHPPTLDEDALPESSPLEDEEEVDLPEISTPTLAEVYFQQGQVQEAVRTYEKVVAQNPLDERSRARLEELRSLLEPSPEEKREEEKSEEKDRERLITILDTWRTNIRGISSRRHSTLDP